MRDFAKVKIYMLDLGICFNHGTDFKFTITSIVDNLLIYYHLELVHLELVQYPQL